MAPEFVWDAFSTTAVIGSLFLALFAIGVGVLARFRGPALHYVLFGAGFGIGSGASHVVAAMERAVGLTLKTRSTPADYTPEMVDWAIASHLTQAAFGGIALWGAIGLIRHYGGMRPRLLLAGAVIGCLQTIAWAMFKTNDALGLWPAGLAAAEFVAQAAVLVLTGVLAMGSVAMARAYTQERNSNQVLLGVALAAYPIIFGMWFLVGPKIGGGPGAEVVWAPLIYTILIAIAWIRAARQSGEKAARRVVQFVVVAALFAVAMSPFPQALHMGGLARAIDVLVVAYAILRHQYLGLDVKLRWGISKTTVAAIFVAVFFMVSEAASAFFGATTGSEYYGIAAAGLLVFAIAPIMRIADRFAASAVPAGGDVESIFRESLRLALKDGRISRDEDVALATQAEHLGIMPTRMMELRRAAESKST